MSFAAGKPARQMAIEKAAWALFQERYPSRDRWTLEKLWSEDERQRQICLEIAGVNADLRAFADRRGAELLTHYGPQVETFPAEMIAFCEDEKQFLARLARCRLLLLTANPVEDRMITHLLYRYNGGRALYWRDLGGKCAVRIADLGGIDTAHLTPLSTGSFSKGGSRDAAACALEHFRPELAVSLGVAFGADFKEQELGDVLVSKRILSWDTNSLTDGKITLRSEEVYPTNDRLFSRWSPFLSSELQLKASHGFRWYFGPLLSGGSVVNGAEDKRRLMDAAAAKGERAVGGEMEGTGLYSVCGGQGVPCVVIKGICDWAVSKNGWAEATQGGVDNDRFKDCVQALAAENAFEALRFLLSKAPIGSLPLFKKELVPRPPAGEAEAAPPFCFSDLKKALAERDVSDGEFLEALLPDYLCPRDGRTAMMEGATPQEVIRRFWGDQELALRHITHKCRLFLRGKDPGVFFRQMRGTVSALGARGEAGALCRSCYQQCTAGPCHPERGLVVLTVFALLGPEGFLSLVPKQDGGLFFCAVCPDE